MTNDELHQTLERLHQEVETLGVGDEAIKERLNNLISDLEYQIENPEDTEKQKVLDSGVRNFIEQFEVEHPRITGIVNQITATLSNIGI